MSHSADQPQPIPVRVESVRADDRVPPPSRPGSTTWQGWAYFGAVMMTLAGFFWAVLGLVALFERDYFAVRTNHLLAAHAYVPWGWVHLIGGVLAVLAGLGVVISGRRWARVVAVVVAGASAVVNLGFVAASPVWSTLVIALDVLVIYALTAHGWELEP